MDSQEHQRFTGAYGAFNAYVADLRPELWRLILGLGIIFLVYMIGTILVFAVGQPQTMGQTPADLLLFLVSFAFLTLGVVLACLWPARRPLASLIGPWGAAGRDFWRVLRAMALLMAAAFVMVLLLDPNVSRSVDMATALRWWPFALVALLIQTSAEEFAFRGFITGQLARRFSRPVIWMGAPALLFGALHYNGAEYGAQAWIVCAATAIFALIASDLTARTGNLGAAIAAHFANNAFAMLLIGETGNLDGLSLYATPMDLTDPFAVAAQFLLTLSIWLAARLALRV